MADRIPQYSMIPNFPNNPNLLQQAQQQQAQHQQQAQQQDHSNLAAFPDQSRLWQMQQQLQLHQQQQQQQQQQFRPRSGADINPNQNAAQMTEMVRNQLLSRPPGQQQMGQQHAPQQFGLSMGIPPQMGGGSNGMGAANQQQSFHEPSSNGSQSSHMLQPNFPNMGGMSNANMNSTLQQRNPNFLAGGPGINRQLELLGMAQNNNFAKFSPHTLQQHREQQQQQLQNPATMSHSSPNDIFSSPGMSNEAIRRPSPSHLQNGGMGPVMPGSQAPGGAMSNQRRIQQDFEQRFMAFNKLAQDKEREYSEMTQQMQARQAQGQPPDPMLLERLKTLSNELKQIKEQITKLNMLRQGQSGGVIMANSQQGGQPQWMGPVQPFEGASHPNRPVPPHLPNQPRIGNNSMVSSGGQNALSQGTSQRIGLGPMQQSAQPGPSFGNQIGMPPAGGQFPFAANSGQVPAQRAVVIQQPINPMQYGSIDQLPPPLEKPRFDNTYKTFCMSKGVKPDPHALSIDNRPIDLYELHVQVMKEGGEAKVSQKDLWSVIGGRMGFVSFPGTDKEPPKSGPGAAQRLSHVYKEYLFTFDTMYITSVRQSKIKMLEQSNNANNIAPGALTGGSAGAGQTLQLMQRMGMTPQQMQMVMSYAHLSIAELQSRGVQPKMIEFVEANRHHLQRTQQEQKMFANRLRPGGGNPPGGSGMPQHPGGPINGPGPGGPVMFPAGNNPDGLIGMRQRPQIANADNQSSQPHLASGNFVRPTSEQMNSAMMMIQRIKQEYTAVAIPQMGAVEIPIDQRVEYNALVEQVYRQASETDSKLHMYYVLLKQPELVKKLIAISVTVTQQRNMLSSGNPRYIVSLERLRMMSNELSKSLELFNATFNALLGKNPGQTAQQPPQSQQTRPPIPQNINGHHEMVPRPPTSHATPSHTSPLQQHSQPSQQLQQQQQHQPSQVSTPSMRSVSIPQPMKPKKPSQGTPSNAVSSPSPASVPSAPTPVQNAPTPTATSAASPQAPKSPKGKTAAKTKLPPQKRRPSKAIPPNTVVPTPEQTSSAVSNGKRAREEEQNPVGVSPGPAPVSEPSPPKRLKTEWESLPGESLKKKEEAVDNIKTEEDASAFLEQMTELIKKAAEGEGPESLTSGISETLDRILKGYGTAPDGSDATVSSFPDSSSRELSPPSAIPAVDAFDEFFDFSYGTLEEDETATPDLVPSSTSTKTSPGSGSEAEGPHHPPVANGSSSDIKYEENLDLLRLGTWKEIDGGESAYYQTSDWKWDSPMPPADQPWLIFPS